MHIQSPPDYPLEVLTDNPYTLMPKLESQSEPSPSRCGLVDFHCMEIFHTKQPREDFVVPTPYRDGTHPPPALCYKKTIILLGSTTKGPREHSKQRCSDESHVYRCS